MTRYAWITDCHFEFLNDDSLIVRFAESIVDQGPVGIFITGDISVSTSLVYHLSVFERIVQRPTYFVLGNHDFYGWDIGQTRKQMGTLSTMSQFLKYMSIVPYIPLTPVTALVGHDGWYDALYGSYKSSKLIMTDWTTIEDFLPCSGGKKYVDYMSDVKDKQALVDLIRKLARVGVDHIAAGIRAAVRYHRNLIILTHCPPYKESHVYNGRVSDDNALSWYTSKLLGDMLIEAARTYPNVNFTVLCGHTHGKHEHSPTSNLRVCVGGAEYGRPAVAGMINVV